MTDTDAANPSSIGLSDRAPGRPAVSVVVPVHNEEDNVVSLIEEIAAALAGRDFEMVFVDDHSTDATLDRLEAAKSRFGTLRVVAHAQNAGQSRAVRTGVLFARAPIVATLDGDGQNDPADLPALLDDLTRADAPAQLAFVGGRRAHRQDSAWKKFGSRLGNGVRRRLLNDEADDTGCGIKAFKRDAFLLLPYFDHMHRFMPALMLREGFSLEFRDVNHRPRQHGASKYTNLGRLKASLADLRGVMWLNTRSRQPGECREV